MKQGTRKILVSFLLILAMLSGMIPGAAMPAMAEEPLIEEALPEQLDDGRLDSADVVGFYLPENVLVEIYPMVLHFAPCRIAETGFRCLVVLEKGTNAALPSVDTTAPGEEKLLWMRNKWMTCHPDSPQKEKGAFVGIHGENLALKI